MINTPTNDDDTAATGKLANIPPDLLQKYKNWELTSRQLAELTGYHAVYLRRSIKRPERPKSTPTSEKTKLRIAREALRKSVADRPVLEIAKIVSVSISTAARIKRKYRTE